MKTIYDIIENDAFDHIYESIILHLSIEDIRNCRLVCRSMKEIVDHPFVSSVTKIRKFKARAHPILRNILSKNGKETIPY